MVFARHFLGLTNKELGKNVKDFSPEVEHIFLHYVWHGNLRELKNVVKRATLLADGDLIESRFLPFEISNFSKLQFGGTGSAAPAPEPVPSTTIIPSNQPMQLASIAPAPQKPVIHDHSLKSASLDAEYEMIVEALKQVNFNKSKAARLLNIDRKTLYNKMKQYQDLVNK